MRSVLALLKLFASVAALVGTAQAVSALRTASACSAKDFGQEFLAAGLAEPTVICSPVASSVCVAVLLGFWKEGRSQRMVPARSSAARWAFNAQRWLRMASSVAVGGRA